MPETSPEGRTHGPRAAKGVLAARILDEARVSFARHGYAGTSIRAIARACDVDAALVHHYFGSKQELLDACTQPPQAWLEGVRAAVGGPLQDRGARILRNSLRAFADPQIGMVLRSMLMTASHDQSTLEKFRRLIADVLVGWTADNLPDDERRKRAAFLASQMLGIVMVKQVWAVEPLASMDEDEIVDAVAPTLQRYLTDDLGEPRGEREIVGQA